MCDLMVSILRGASFALMLGLAACGGKAFGQNQDEALRPLCTDRPTKSTGACTVDAGHFQLESDLFNVTLDRSSGVDTDTYLFTNPTLKLGVTDTLDVEASLAPVVHVTTRDRATGAKTSTTGIGDLFLRAKLGLIGTGGGDLAIAVSPYLKVPTARIGIGNGAVEGGVIIPVSYSLADNWSLSLDPEVDLLENQSGNGQHAGIINLISVSRTIGEVTAAAELWSNIDLEPSGSIRQYSFDLGAAWVPGDQPDTQFDGGVNIGLNKVTPDWQAYLGVSHRF
jgi:hypothetical protein